VIRRNRQGHPSTRRRPPTPDHLVVWLTGVAVSSDGPVLLDDELAEPAFDVRAWVQGVRGGYPGSALAVVYDGDPGSPWRERLERVVRAVRDGDGRFTGDTTPTSLAQQRAWTRSVLEPHPEAVAERWREHAVGDVVLVVDELVSNVEQHAKGWLTIDAVVDDGAALVAVTDPCPDRLPVPRPAEPSDPSGRGLLVVDALAPSWGVLVGRDVKSVWAWIPLVEGEDRSDLRDP
jgi:anti-sigma regulatory factor (Ser/Thr protein kinase)